MFWGDNELCKVVGTVVMYVTGIGERVRLLVLCGCWWMKFSGGAGKGR